MAKKTPTEELAKTAPMAMAAPSFIPTGQATGTEHITKDDVQMPRLALAQTNSPELDKTDDKYIDDLDIADLFNNLTKQVYGPGPLEFIVVRADKPRYVEFKPLSEGGGIVDFNVPADDPRTQFGENGKAPVATKFYDFIIMLLGHNDELIALSLKSTGIKVAKKLNSMIKMRNAPIYAGRYVLTTDRTENAKGKFSIYKVDNAGWAPDEATYKKAESFHNALAGKTIHIDREPGADDTADDFDTKGM